MARTQLALPLFPNQAVLLQDFQMVKKTAVSMLSFKISVKNGGCGQKTMNLKTRMRTENTKKKHPDNK